MDKNRKIKTITLPILGMTLSPPEGKNVTEADIEKLLSDISNDMDGSHDLIYTYEELSEEENDRK